MSRDYEIERRKKQLQVKKINSKYTKNLYLKVEVGKSAWKIFIQRGRDLDEEANYRQLLERMSKSEKMTIYP